jgi:nickel-dependent lactate racemase
MITGRGSASSKLSEEDVLKLCSEAFELEPFSDKRVLVVLPDNTRTAPVDLIFKTVYRLLSDRVRTLDVLFALGTHPQMSDGEMDQRLGAEKEGRRRAYPKARFFNHRWDDASQLRRIGTVSADEMESISGGRMRQETPVAINSKIFDYDILMPIGPTYPHEVFGFSGGVKYFFPGICGKEIIDALHWLGALITSSAIIGTRDTPVRSLANRAASFIPVRTVGLSLAVKGGTLAGLFIGPPQETFEAAAEVSDKIHIEYKKKPFQTIVACAPAMYTDLWTGAKCAYKTEPVVADGGEIIVVAPHLREISVTHGAVLERIGYHVLEYFTKQMDRFREVPQGILAHSTHVKGLGTYENGIEKPRNRVTLATGIPESTCSRVNLGYRDPGALRLEEWKNREDGGVLFVEKAGETLYRLKK